MKKVNDIVLLFLCFECDWNQILKKFNQSCDLNLNARPELMDLRMPTRQKKQNKDSTKNISEKDEESHQKHDSNVDTKIENNMKNVNLSNQHDKEGFQTNPGLSRSTSGVITHPIAAQSLKISDRLQISNNETNHSKNDTIDTSIKSTNKHKNLKETSKEEEKGNKNEESDRKKKELCHSDLLDLLQEFLKLQPFVLEVPKYKPLHLEDYHDWNNNIWPLSFHKYLFSTPLVSDLSDLEIEKICQMAASLEQTYLSNQSNLNAAIVALNDQILVMSHVTKQHLEDVQNHLKHVTMLCIDQIAKMQLRKLSNHNNNENGDNESNINNYDKTTKTDDNNNKNSISNANNNHENKTTKSDNNNNNTSNTNNNPDNNKSTTTDDNDNNNNTSNADNHNPDNNNNPDNTNNNNNNPDNNNNNNNNNDGSNNNDNNLKRKFSSKKEKDLIEEEQYICTGMDLYLYYEPCVMWD